MAFADAPAMATAPPATVTRELSEVPPLFVVSMWRAGSSLLYALLNQHSQVALMYEADLHLLKPVFLKPPFLRDWPKRWEFWNEAVSRHQIPPANAPSNASFSKALETAYRGYAAARGAAIWGDKSPNYYDCMTSLARKFPGAWFIVVWRDPVDTARSMMRAATSTGSFFTKRGIRTRALLGYQVMRRQYQALVRQGAPIYAIHYEDLVRDTRGTMEGVCRFLQIPFEERVLTLENADRSATFEGEHHRSLRGDRIVAHDGRPEVLAGAFRDKIARYVRLWKRTEHGWIASRSLAAAEVEEPGIVERICDEAAYRYWKLFDHFTAVVYSFVPLAILQRYRNRPNSPDALAGISRAPKP
jgi:hypothetical protein